MSLIFTSAPQRGDIVLGYLPTKEIKYCPLVHFTKSDVTADYEIIGVVAFIRGKQVGIIYKNNSVKTYTTRYWWKLGGYTLDGTDRQGTLNVMDSLSVSSQKTAYTISYNATTQEQLVDILNTYFVSKSALQAIEMGAYTKDGEIYIRIKFTQWWQPSTNGSDGFTLTWETLKGWEYCDKNLRRNGANGNNGAISNVPRAIKYYGDATSNIVSPITSIKRDTVVPKTDYLNNPHCQFLRDYFGEGEEGWLKHIESCRPVYPTDRNGLGMKRMDGFNDFLASFTDGITREQISPLGAYMKSISTECLPNENWVVPDEEELCRIMDGVTRGTDANWQETDLLNSGLSKIGGTALPNNAYPWSCVRHNAGNAWVSHGAYGGLSYGTLCGGGSACVPLALLNF